MRKIKRVCRKFGIPQDMRTLGLIVLAVAILSILSHPVIAKVSEGNFWSFWSFWSGRFALSVPFEKQESGTVTRRGIFEGEAVFNSERGCWEVSGKIKEGLFGVPREKVRTQNCRAIVNSIK